MVDKAFRFDLKPSEWLLDFMKLDDSDAAFALLQVRLRILAQNGPIENKPDELGKFCSMSRAKMEKVIHRLMARPVEPRLYLTDDGLLSCKTCETLLETVRKLRKKSSDSGHLGAEIRWQNQENQPDKNGPPIISEMASTSTSPIPEGISNIKPIPVLGTAREGLAGGAGGAGFKNLSGILGGMFGAIRTAGFDIAAFIPPAELSLLIRDYCPGCAEQQVVNLFNNWVIKEKIAVRQPRPLLVKWMKKSQWLRDQTATMGTA